MSDSSLSKVNWGKIEFSDDHFLARFPREDYKHINEKYIAPIVTINDMVDTALDEIYQIKRQIISMEHYDNNKKMVWTYPHKNINDASKFYSDYQRIQSHLTAMTMMRADLMQEFHNNLTKNWNDQTIADKKFEPDEQTKAEDLVPLVGVAQAAKQITHETFRTWDYFGLGRSDVPADFDNEFLLDEIGRYFIKTHGSLGAIGEVIRLLVVSPDDMGTEDIQEICVADAKSGGTILFRAVLEKSVHHEAGEHFLASSANIYLVSRR